MKRGRPVSGLPNRYFLFIFLARFQDVGRGPPIPLGKSGEIPGMAFSAGKITTGLIDGQVIFRTGKVDGRDQSQDAIVRPFESGFAGKRPRLFGLHETASLRISLSNQIAFHLKSLSHAIFSLQVVVSV